MSEKGPQKILFVGAVMVDLVCQVPSLPASGEGVVTSRREMRLGGCAFNSASMASQLGADCFLMAPMGNGPCASFARSELSNKGLEAYQVQTDMDCGMCVCLIEPDGERTMVTIPGIERHFDSTWFDSLNAADYSLALASGYEVEGPGGDAIISFMERNPQIDFIYAPGPRVLGVDEQKMRRITALSPIFHLNDQEAVGYASERLGITLEGDRQDLASGAGLAIAGANGNVAVITMGSDGSGAFFPDGSSMIVPTTPLDPIDTVGAGDAHLGALVAARNAGFGWRESLAIANEAAAAVCMVPGSFLTKEQHEFAGLRLS